MMRDIRVALAGVCRTDVYVAQGQLACRDPLVLGHELAGVVVDRGAEVADLRTGDVVTVAPLLPCQRCRACRPETGPVRGCLAPHMLGVDQDGAFAEFVKIPASNIIKLDPSIPEHYGAILDPLGNAVHTVLAGPIAGCTVLVTGCGQIGQVGQRLGFVVKQRRATLLQLGLRDGRFGHLPGCARLLLRELGPELASIPDRSQLERHGGRDEHAPEA